MLLAGCSDGGDATTAGSSGSSSTTTTDTATTAPTAPTEGTSSSSTTGEVTGSSGGDDCDSGTCSTSEPPPPEICGDGALNLMAEQCDLGAMNDDAGVCTTSCTVAFCGDGKVFAGTELCDDGNPIADDGCDNACGVVLPPPPPPVRLVSGYGHSCAVSPVGVVRCWGGFNPDLSFGQLGYGHLDGVGDEPGEMPPPDVDVGGPAVQISAGNWHTCVLLVDGTVRCWGRNDEGQLGDGTLESRGDEPGEMPPPAVALGGLATQVSVSRQEHACALMVDGRVRCWGSNGHRELGVDSEDDMVGDEPGEMPPEPVELPGKAIAVAAGVFRTCAVLESGTLVCWGGFGSEALPAVVPVGGPVVEVAGNGTDWLVRLDTGVVRAWGQGPILGYNHNDMVLGPYLGGDVPLGGAAERIVVSGEHACALVTDGGLRCWGSNAGGALGYGHSDSLGNKPGEMPTPEVVAGGEVAEVAVGSAITCVRLASGDHTCWGLNEYGNLGHGHKMSIGDDPGEMPPAIVPVF